MLRIGLELLKECLMQMDHIHYNARRRVFRAQIALPSNGEMRRFPCEVAGDPTMSPARVMKRIRQRALKLSVN